MCHAIAKERRIVLRDDVARTLSTGIEDVRLEAQAGPLQTRLEPMPLFAANWCTVHHLMAHTTPHRAEMRRSAHTLLVFDGDSYGDGQYRMVGAQVGTARFGAIGPLDVGVYVVPADTHLIACSGATSHIGVTIITLDRDCLGEVVGKQTARLVGHGLRPEFNVRNELLTQLIARVRRWSVVAGEAQVDAIQRETILMLAMQEIARLQCLQSPAARRYRGGLSARAQRLIREFVAANLDARIRLQTLADLAGMSRFHFSRAFKVSFGLSPHQYLSTERVRVAAERVRNSRDPITDIALQVGFSCSSELTRLFKQTMGCTPSELRSERRYLASTAALPGRPQTRER